MLLKKKNERKAMQLLEQLEVTSYPHITDKKAREQIIKSITDQIPKPPKDKQPPRSAQEQYEALKARMKGR